MYNVDVVTDLLYSDLTYRIRGSVFKVYNTLGFGHKESVYHKALAIEFKKNNMPYEEEVPVDVKYETEKVDKKGKVRKVYQIYLTPYEALKKIPNAKKYLKPGTTFTKLEKISMQYSDNEYASIMDKEKNKLFDKIVLKPIDF